MSIKASRLGALWGKNTTQYLKEVDLNQFSNATNSARRRRSRSTKRASEKVGLFINVSPNCHAEVITKTFKENNPRTSISKCFNPRYSFLIRNRETNIILKIELENLTKGFEKERNGHPHSNQRLLRKWTNVELCLKLDGFNEVNSQASNWR